MLANRLNVCLDMILLILLVVFVIFLKKNIFSEKYCDSGIDCYKTYINGLTGILAPFPYTVKSEHQHFLYACQCFKLGMSAN